MRAVIQRVSKACVVVDDAVIGQIGAGVLVYLGVASEDTSADIDYMVNKVRHLRIFNDTNDKMNLDIDQVSGSCLVVSAFTTQGDARKGNRPAYTAAAAPEKAETLYDLFCGRLRDEGLAVETGRFRAKMAVDAVNDGPICVLIDSRKTF
jgi:D-tyrosyl-tRNA(Tyr) deacylase